eukprot:3341373-Pyramimonas_sp.AAC.1
MRPAMPRRARRAAQGLLRSHLRGGAPAGNNASSIKHMNSACDATRDVANSRLRFRSRVRSASASANIRRSSGRQGGS